MIASMLLALVWTVSCTPWNGPSSTQANQYESSRISIEPTAAPVQRIDWRGEYLREMLTLRFAAMAMSQVTKVGKDSATVTAIYFAIG